MAAKIAYADVAEGMPIPGFDVVLRRVDLVRYCGACCDYTPIHWNERVAKSVGLPNVAAHGTLTLASAVRAVTDWVGDPGALVSYEIRRFTVAVAVPDDDDGVTLHVTGQVAEKLPGNQVRVKLGVSVDGRTVMSGASAVVELS